MNKNDSWDRNEMYVMNKLEDIENTLGHIETKLDKEIEERNRIDKKLTGLKAKLASIALVVSTIVTMSLRSLFK